MTKEQIWVGIQMGVPFSHLGIALSQLCALPQVQHHLGGEDPPGAEGAEASASH